MRPIAYTLPYGRCTLIAAGCLHWPIGEKDLIQKWVRSVATSENGFTILMGDTLDCARTHYRDHIRGYRQDENSQLALDELIKREVETLARELEPIKDRIIGAILGNHFWSFSDGTNSEQYLCRLLGIRYLGPTGIVRLEFRDRNGKGRVRNQLVLYAHHKGGSNGGRTTGGDVNALERIENSFDADIYLLSHTHRRYATRNPLLTLSRKGSPYVVERPKVFIRTGAFLKGYAHDNPNVDQPHFPSYAESAAMRPTDLGVVTLTIDMTHNKDGVPGKVHEGQSYVKTEMTVSY